MDRQIRARADFRNTAAPPCVLLLAAALVALLTPHAGAGSNHSDTRLAPQPATLLTWDREARGLTPLEPLTLEDAPVGPVLTSPASSVPWVASADGSTLVSLEQSRVVVRDGETLTERIRFRPPVVTAFAPVLSPDGSKLALMTKDYPLEWIALETASGRLLTTISTDDYKPLGGGPFFPKFWIDSDGSYLESLVCACSGEGTGPAPAQLVRYDLATGQEARRLELPEVLAGTWRIAGGERLVPVVAHLTPGVALSPDGRRLAVVHADAQAVTVVDLLPFAVERTVAITRPTGVVDRLLGLLPLVPQGASAKGIAEGPLRAAVFHPDGRHVYVFGFEEWKDVSGVANHRGLGLQRVDLATGEVVAEIGADAWFEVVLPAPDGQSVYVVGGTPGEVTDEGTLLRRLDATTLEPLAERQLTWSFEVLLLPIELERG